MAYKSKCTPYLQSGRCIARHEQTICPKGRHGVKCAPDLISSAHLPYFHCQRQFGVQGATVNFRKDPGNTPKWSRACAMLTNSTVRRERRSGLMRASGMEPSARSSPRPADTSTSSIRATVMDGRQSAGVHGRVQGRGGSTGDGRGAPSASSSQGPGHSAQQLPRLAAAAGGSAGGR